MTRTPAAGPRPPAPPTATGTRPPTASPTAWTRRPSPANTSTQADMSGTCNMQIAAFYLWLESMEFCQQEIPNLLLQQFLNRYNPKVWHFQCIYDAQFNAKLKVWNSRFADRKKAKEKEESPPTGSSSYYKRALDTTGYSSYNNNSSRATESPTTTTTTSQVRVILIHETVGGIIMTHLFQRAYGGKSSYGAEKEEENSRYSSSSRFSSNVSKTMWICRHF